MNINDTTEDIFEYKTNKIRLFSAKTFGSVLVLSMYMQQHRNVMIACSK